MPSLALPDRLIWFAHCPKAGGTSVEQFMVAHWGDAVGHLHWGWDLWWKRGGWRVADPPNSPQHLVWTDALAALERRPDAVFAVVRDPVARLASEHRWQRHKRRGTKLGKLLAFLPFSLWLPLMLAVARRNHHAFDNHLRPQADFVPDGARVFRLEDGLAPVATWLAEETGAPLAAAELPHAIPSGTGPEISPCEAGQVGVAFAADYARFGYRRPPSAEARWLVRALANGLAILVTWAERRGAL